MTLQTLIVVENIGSPGKRAEPDHKTIETLHTSRLAERAVLGPLGPVCFIDIRLEVCRTGPKHTMSNARHAQLTACAL
jgi:hypothetical protein